jgi:hypothetical protein
LGQKFHGGSRGEIFDFIVILYYFRSTALSDNPGVIGEV